ncbi:MAG: HAMP domain-containing protein [Proteobacteria bacterium]|nr:HAMP domain-containing protein [Pseudomonadota bacterium]
MSEPLKSKSFVIRQSLFRRILILMTLAAVAIGVIVVGLFRMSTQRRLESRYNIALRNIGIYAKGVSAELDHFKDSELQDAVERLLQERGFLTRVRLPDGRYVESKVQRTDDIFSNAETIDSWLWRKEGTKFAFVKGRPVLSVAGQSFHGNREYLFTMERPDSIDFDERILVLGIALPLLVIGLLYQGVRRMLLPLKTLQQGVESVSQGNLAVQLDDSGHDELAVLANSFNRMTFELKRMMASREELLLGVSHELRTPLTRAPQTAAR